MAFEIPAIFPFFSLITGFAAVAGLVAGWLFARYRYIGRISAISSAAGEMKRDLTRIIQGKEDEIEGLRKQIEGASFELRTLNERLLVATEEKVAAQEKVAAFGDMRTVMADTYTAISARNLEESNRAFMRLADTVLSKYVDAAKADFKHKGKVVESTIKPIRDALERYDRHIQDMERSREKAYGSLSQQVQSLAMAQSELNKETNNLVKALRLPQVRGRWGEMTLRRVVELAGMQRRCDFLEQQSTISDAGILRPDMIVALPSDRQVVVDAKVPLAAYLDALEVDSETKREDLLARHARQLKDHITKLSQKAYWQSFQPTPEFVVLFIPGESFFSAALSVKPDLIEYGAQRNIVIATPTTLISLLKTVALGWRQVETAQNTHAISALGSELYKRLHVMTAHFEELGRGLDRCVSGYNRLIGSFERRVLPSARKFTAFGVADENGKPLASPGLVDERPRQLNPDNGEDGKDR